MNGSASGTTVDHEHLLTSARTLVTYRRRRARSRDRVRAVLDAMAAEARRSLGPVFTDNDPLTNQAVALVVRSDERLPDDYAKQTPRPPTDTVNRLIVEVLGQVLIVEISDAGDVRAGGDTHDLGLDGVTDVRIADGARDAPAFLVVGNDDPAKRTEIPFIRVLAKLIDRATVEEVRFNLPGAADDDRRADSGASPARADSEEPAVREAGDASK